MPRVGLTREHLVAEAALLVDEVGYERLTLAALAQRVGVATPSLYKHIDGQQALRADLAALAARELGATLARAVMSRSGADALRAIADAYRAFARQHPGRYAATVRAPTAGDAEHAAATEEALAVVLAVLAGYGLEGDDAIDAARLLRSALHGFTSLEAAGGFGLPRDLDRSFERLVDGLHTALRHWP